MNTASRMESHGAPGRIQATTSVKDKLEGDYDFTPRGKVDLKGVGSVEAWWLVGRQESR